MRSKLLALALVTLGATQALSGCAWLLASPQPEAPRRSALPPVPTPSAEPTARPFVLPAPSRVKLPNGLVAWSVRRRHLPLVTVRLVVRAGERHEESRFAGTAAITAELLRRGAGARDARQYQAALDATGGRFAFEAGPDATVITATVLRRDLDLAVSLLADAVQDPWFEVQELAEVCREHQADIDGLRDDGDALADTLLRHVVLRGHPYGRLPSRRAIDALMRRDVRRFHRSWFRPERTHLTIVGDVTATEARQVVARRFGAWRRHAAAQREPGRQAPPKAPTRMQVWVMDLAVSQSYIRLGTPLPARSKLAWHQVDALNFVLGGDFTSRLNLELRDRQGLAYGAYSRFEAWREAGLLSARVNTRTESTRRAVDRLLAVVRGLRRTAPSRDEAETARRYLSGSFPMRFETNAALAEEFSDLALCGLPEAAVAGYREALRGVTPGSLYRQARAYVPDQGLHLVVVGPAGKIVPALRGLGDVKVLRRDEAFR
ncbi:MAG: pitrilysin family protein [Candidatus Sericytochromatia bacterium]|nr:pitrilysin family protein [Candidatus Sericytochromatia bacterium]